MNYIIFSINNNIEELMFIFSYNKGEKVVILGELVKLNDLFNLKGMSFNFFEVAKDPTSILFKNHIYIYKYNTFGEAVDCLNIQLTTEELKDLNLQNKEVYNISTKKNKNEILSLLYKEKHKNAKLLKKLFFK